MKVILIVDDEVDILDTFSLLFELQGYEVMTAPNGKEALQALEGRIPDLIISDCMMPVMDGIAFCKAVRANATFASIPFLLMSGAPEHHEFAALSFDAFLQKPFQFDRLAEAVQNLLDEH